MVKVSIFHRSGLDGGRTYLMDDKAERCLRLVAYTGQEKVHLDEAFSGKSARTTSFVTQDIFLLKDTERAKILARELG